MVLDQPAKAGSPGEKSFDHRAPRQQHEAALGARQLDRRQLGTVRLRGVSGFRAGGALVDISQVDALNGGGLYGLGQPPHFGAVVRAGGRDA